MTKRGETKRSGAAGSRALPRSARSATSSNKNQGTPLRELILLLKKALNRLHYNIPNKKLEELANRVFFAMENRTRSYHSTQHILKFSNLRRPIQILAAIYHDVIYYQVDREFPAPWKELHQVSLSTNRTPHLEALLDLVRVLFDTSELDLNDTTYFPKLNEYFSFLAAFHDLSAILSPRELLELAIHIEQTRPFRKNTPTSARQGERASAILSNKFGNSAAIHKYGFSLNRSEIDQMIESAISLANHDVSGFASKDASFFITESWSLLPEGDSAVRNPSTFTFTQWRLHLASTLNFVEKMDPETVFHSYKNKPSKQVFERLTKQAHSNIQTFCFYLKSRILAAATLEALYSKKSRSPFITLIMGDLTSASSLASRLPIKRRSCSKTYFPTEQRAISVLEQGLAKTFWFDIVGDTLSLFLTQNLTRDEFHILYYGIPGNETRQPNNWIPFLAKMPTRIASTLEAHLKHIDPLWDSKGSAT